MAPAGLDLNQLGLSARNLQTPADQLSSPHYAQAVHRYLNRPKAGMEMPAEYKLI
jgi:hypothetical protein